MKLSERMRLDAADDGWDNATVDEVARLERVAEVAQDVIKEVSPMNSDAASSLKQLREALKELEE